MSKCYYRQEALTCRYCFNSRADFWVFRPTGVTRCTDQGEIWQGGADPVCSSLDRFRGVGLRPQKLLPKGRVPCTILIKLAGFMRILSLHKCDTIINNLPWWGYFQPNFWWPLAAKLLMDPKKIGGEMMARTTSIIMVEIARRTSAWEDKVWYFHFFS